MKIAVQKLLYFTLVALCFSIGGATWRRETGKKRKRVGNKQAGMTTEVHALVSHDLSNKGWDARSWWSHVISNTPSCLDLYLPNQSRVHPDLRRVFQSISTMLRQSNLLHQFVVFWLVTKLRHLWESMKKATSKEREGTNKSEWLLLNRSARV